MEDICSITHEDEENFETSINKICNHVCNKDKKFDRRFLLFLFIRMHENIGFNVSAELITLSVVIIENFIKRIKRQKEINQDVAKSLLNKSMQLFLKCPVNEIMIDYFQMKKQGKI